LRYWYRHSKRHARWWKPFPRKRTDWQNTSCRDPLR